MLEKHAISEMIDPKLNGCYAEEEVLGMLQCASLCIRRDPSLRPRISQVRYTDNLNTKSCFFNNVLEKTVKEFFLTDNFLPGICLGASNARGRVRLEVMNKE